MIDILEFLSEHDIDYKLDGKNIGRDWIGISPCPSCSDTRYHAAIHKENGNVTCWVCKNNISFLTFVRLIKGISYKEAKEYVSTLSDEEIITDEDITFRVKQALTIEKHEETKKFEEIITLPPNTRISRKIINIHQPLKEFLERRRITRDDCETLNFRLGIYGIDKNKLIMPIRSNKKLIAYQTRDLIKKEYYFHGKPKNCLYRSQFIDPNKTLIIVEGIIDYIMVNKYINRYERNKYCVTSSFTKELDPKQIDIIHNLGVKSVLFMLDRDAWFRYYKNGLDLYIDHDFLILPPNTDPGSMTQMDLLQFFNRILGNNNEKKIDVYKPKEIEL